MASSGFPSQVSTSEGDLSATFLGQNALSSRVVRLNPHDGGTYINSGTLSGVTQGSIYGLFATNSEAAGTTPPTVRAKVASVTPYYAKLAPDAPVGPGLAWGREIEHKLADQSLRVRIDAPKDVAEKIHDVIKDQSLVLEVKDDPQFVIKADAAGVHFFGADGSLKGEAGSASSPDFPAKIADAVRKVAEYEAILSLYKGATGDPPSITLANDQPDTNNPPPTPQVRLSIGAHPFLALTNTATDSRYLYLLDLEPDYSVNILYPRQNKTEDLFTAGKTIQAGQIIRPTTVGASKLILLSTHDPIDVGSFRQSGVARSIGGTPSTLERLLMAAKAGKRSIESSAAVVDWSASEATVVVSN